MKKILPGEKRAASSNIRIDGTLSSDKSLIAGSFNKFFTSAVTRLLESARSSCVSVANTIQLSTRLYPDFKFEEVSEAFVKCLLRNLKRTKAVGLDDIPGRLLVDSAEVVAKPICAIINLSLKSGVVPTEWKAARVIPLFKKGKREDMDNYRPISILPAVSKVLERAVHHQLYAYLQRHKILSPFQCGFRKSHSTEWAAMCFADTIRRNIDQGRLTGAVFIDLRKAFDTVDHAVLLRKLSSLGVVQSELHWFRNYLMNRTQVVDYHDVSSAAESVSIGVPQGSILGPLLFILHLNDLPDVVVECSILMYADDTVLFFSAPQASTIQETLNRELGHIMSWLRLNSLFINVIKTEAMLLGTSQRLARVDNFSIIVNGSIIKRVSEFKYLGIIFDEHLNWNRHVKSIVSKAGKRVGLLGRLRRYLTAHSANTIYISMIRPIIEYCVGVWACCGEVNSGYLEALQKCAARVVVKSGSSSDAMASVMWPTLKERRTKHVYNLVNKSLAGRCPQHFINYFKHNKDVCVRSTRQSKLLHLPAVRTEVAKRSFYYHGCTVYNNFKSF